MCQTRWSDRPLLRSRKPLGRQSGSTRRPSVRMEARRRFPSPTQQKTIHVPHFSPHQDSQPTQLQRPQPPYRGNPRIPPQRCSLRCSPIPREMGRTVFHSIPSETCHDTGSIPPSFPSPRTFHKAHATPGSLMLALSPFPGFASCRKAPPGFRPNPQYTYPEESPSPSTCFVVRPSTKSRAA